MGARQGRARVGLLVAAAITLGCGPHPLPGMGPAPEPERTTASEHFGEALSAHARGDYGDAISRLRVVRERCAGRELGDRAFLLLVATRLDPRFRDGRPDSAAAGTARYLSADSTSRWGRAVAESLHLIARDMGGYAGADAASPAPHRAADGADCELPTAALAASSDSGQALPSLSRPSLQGEIRILRTRVDSLRAEVERLRELLKTPPPR